jgi:hypothetical protein
MLKFLLNKIHMLKLKFVVILQVRLIRYNCIFDPRRGRVILLLLLLLLYIYIYIEREREAFSTHFYP